MNDLYKSALHALVKNIWLIVVVTVLAGALATTKELLFPVPYQADTILLVTGVEERGDTTKLMPSPLNPKAYETLLTGTSVLGKTLDRLKEDGVFGAAKPPKLRDFAADLEVKVDVVDETSRPLNYSPLVHIKAYAETAELAKKIVDTWADTATAQAQRTASMRVGAPAFMLAREKGEYESALESAWTEMSKETAVWDLDVLKADLQARVTVVNSFMEKRTGLQRQYEVAKTKLELIRGDITAMVKGSLGEYTDATAAQREKLKTEMSQANVELIDLEMNKKLALRMRLAEEQGDIERQLKGDEESLATIRKSLETEKPILELGRAPSETAYWIAGSANAKALTDLKDKLMVTQELNPVHLELKKSENEKLSEISKRKAEVESIKAQVAVLDGEITSLKDQYGQHKMSQAEITNNLTMSEQMRTTFGTDEEMSVFGLERGTMLEVKGLEVELAELDKQTETLKGEMEALKQQIAEHTMIQTRLRTRTDVAKKIFDDVSAAESFMTAAHGIALGESGQDKPVGLNRISAETYATEDRGLLGRKGRVLMTTVLAFLLTCAFAYIKDDGAPRLRKWLVTLD